MKKLVWKNLIENTCPKCAGDMTYYPMGDQYMCSILCGFMIKRVSVEKIVAKLTKVEYEGEDPLFFDAPVESMDDIGDNQIGGYEEDE